MSDADIGDVIALQSDGTVCGIVTDRDIVVRAVADGADPRREVESAVSSPSARTDRSPRRSR
ncbi:MAG: hypothetical protein R6X29_01260 [Acidimicrobiia bacterium]|jgi:signal-transduction protein with cAMP-binding, CBS, and nucleotidyltransferase domain